MNNLSGKELEKYSSAFTLSDMEIFIFPELFYPLVVANIMSPIIWEWTKNPWFKDIQKKSFSYKANRVKQFIMDNFVFNLDLETWGMTTKQKEIARFADFFDMQLLSQSNALFGYEGDKYYYSIDIRKHFGLDKYTSEVIPYWKTETVEAMNAFRLKEGFVSGAGECVSLSALYAATLFVVAKIPLEKIFLIATPLHSQNFIMENDGLVTNNRRIVTKTMWFNGTALTDKARRAMENEKVTIVSHISGFIHTEYPKASIDPKFYDAFSKHLHKFLKTPITPAIFVNFLRYESNFKNCFQYKHQVNGKPHYIELSKIFEYEHASKNNFSDSSRQALLKEIEMEEFELLPIENKLLINDIENYITSKPEISVSEMQEHFMALLPVNCSNKENLDKLFAKLASFIETKPRLPKTDKEFEKQELLPINTQHSRDEILEIVNEFADKSEFAKLIQYTFRQMDKIDWQPFIKAALERNPVCIEGLKGKNADEVFAILQLIKNDSIYDGFRMAQPDEVWNFQSGDGIEKAFLLANFIKNNEEKPNLLLQINKEKVELKSDNESWSFSSVKGIEKEMRLF